MFGHSNTGSDMMANEQANNPTSKFQNGNLPKSKAETGDEEKKIWVDAGRQGGFSLFQVSNIVSSFPCVLRSDWLLLLWIRPDIEPAS